MQMALFQSLNHYFSIARKGVHMGITEKSFGLTADGAKTFLYEITNHNGLVMKVTNYGAILVSFLVPDRLGILKDVVLGYDDVTGYQTNPNHFGSTIGRNGNRIEGGRFIIDNTKYQLTQNDNESNNLHSGPDGYEWKLWEVQAIDDKKNSITFFRRSPDKEQGFPGNFDISVTYELTADNGLAIHYSGICDQDTVVNMTNHSYFNLGGHDGGSIEDHELLIKSTRYTPVKDYQSIPTGELQEVTGTPMDFTIKKTIGKEIDVPFDQLQYTGGYDHNYVLDWEPGTMKEFAKAHCSKTGISMIAATDLPGVQFYTGNFITSEPGKGDAVYQKRAGFCLETQYYPNAVNQSEFPSPLLEAHKKYQTSTCYQFFIEN